MHRRLSGSLFAASLRVLVLLMSSTNLAGCSGARDARVLSSSGSLHVSATPILSIESTARDGSVLFDRVSNAVRLEDGTVVVADPGGFALRYFDRHGALVATAGRAGSGPGEFQYVGWVGRCGAGEVHVWDPIQLRLTVFDAMGRFIRQQPLPVHPALIQCDEKGAFAALLMPKVFTRPDPNTGVSPKHFGDLLAWQRDADSAEKVGSLPLGESRPLGVVTRMAVGPGGIYVGTGDSSTLQIYGFDGRRIEDITIPIERRLTTAANYDAAVTRLVSGFAIASEREAAKKSMLAIPMPQYLPLFRDILVDPLGIIWVVTSAPGDSLTSLVAVRRDGSIQATATIRGDLAIHEVGSDYLLATRTTSGGEEEVVVYSVSRD